MKYAVIDLAASGTVVAAVTGKRIRVVSYVLSAAGAVAITWKSGTTALSGAMTLATGIPLCAAPPEALFGGLGGQLQTEPGEALNLTLSGAVQVSGHLIYDETP